MKYFPYSYTHQANQHYPNTFWRSLMYFNLYRLTVGTIMLFALLTLVDRSDWNGTLPPGQLYPISIGYWLFGLASIFTIRARKPIFNVQLTAQVAIDIVFIITLMYFNGGIRSGLGLLLMPYLAAAGLISRGKMTLFHAAIASIGVLFEHTLRVLQADTGVSDYTQPGLLSIGYFATAWLAHRLAQYAKESEKVAAQRGIDLANMAQINHLIIKDMPDGVLVIDDLGTVRTINIQAQRLLGSPRVRDKLVLGDYFPALEAAQANWRDGHTQSEVILRVPQTDKLIRARFVEIEANRASGAVIFLDDVQRQQAETQQLKLAALGRLTANIAHEIRNPLSSISHAAELLAEEASEDPIQIKLTRIIRDNTKRLNSMVSDILQLNRRDRAQPEQIRLAQFLHGLSEEMHQTEQMPVASIKMDCPDDLSISFDRSHLHQVLWNLVRNAWRYCQRRPGSILIDVRRDGPQVQIDICDDGPGVKPEHLQQLFEPFFTTDDSNGSGLGLYIAREVCAANRSQLEYVESPGGAIFRLTARIWQ